MKIIKKNYRPLCFIKDKLLIYKREKLLLMDPKDFTVEEVCDLKIEDSRRAFCFCDFGERLSHIYAYCAIETQNGAYIAFNRGIYFLDIKKKKLIKEHQFVLEDMRRPLNFYNIKDVSGFDNMVLCPDYSYNEKREAVAIYAKRSEDIGWKKVFAFHSNTVRHIHSVIADKYRNRVLIFTGDLGEEAAIWEATENFSKVVKIAGSSQKYRACCGRAYPEGVVIVTDSPFDQNYIYLMKGEDSNTEFKVLEKMPGPVVFWTNYRDKVIFATDVEWNERKAKGLKKYINYERGPGVQDKYVHIFFGEPKAGFKEVEKLKKDIFPMGILGFGNVHFPNGEIADKIFFYPTAVKRYNQKLCYFSIDEIEAINENS